LQFLPERHAHLTDSGNIVADTAARIFSDLADPQTVNRASDARWKDALWQALADAGLTLAWVPDKFGGSDAGLDDGFAVLRIAGRFAVAVPLAETLIAGWLLARAGIASPEGAMTIAPVRPKERVTLNADGTLSGRVSAVPFARAAKHLAVVASGGKGAVAALVAADQCRIAYGQSLGGDDANIVTFDRATPVKVAAAPNELLTELMLFGSTARSVQTAGALEAILSLSVAYANERVAFERPIGKFQAVQQNLAHLAGEVAAALAVSGSAADTFVHADGVDDGVFLEAASAKIRCAEAAQDGAAIAHQVFGAIGFTKEHVLHRFTLRMLAWRDDFGNESYWANELGKQVARRGADEFWPLVASR
jgi:acyl-CoA dehydrogenase